MKTQTSTKRRSKSVSPSTPKLPIWYAKPSKVDYRKHGLFTKLDDKLYCPPPKKPKAKVKKSNPKKNTKGII